MYMYSYIDIFTPISEIPISRASSPATVSATA